MPGYGQPEFGTNGWIEMEVTNLEINESGMPPSLILSTTQDFEIAVTFGVQGDLIPLIMDLMDSTPEHDFEVEYFAETVGPGTDLSLGVKQIHSNWRVPISGNHYEFQPGSSGTTLVVPAGTLNPGTYKLACIVRVNPAYGGASPWTGFYEGPVIQIHP